MFIQILPKVNKTRYFLFRNIQIINVMFCFNPNKLNHL